MSEVTRIKSLVEEIEGLKTVIEEQREGWDATLAENKRLLERQQEHLSLIRSYSLQIPFPEEASQVPTLIAEVGTLRSKIVALKLRPPMTCLPCEEFNLKLADELEALRKNSTLVGREALAWAAFELGADLSVEDMLDNTEKGQQAKALFDKWWALSNNFVE